MIQFVIFFGVTQFWLIYNTPQSWPLTYSISLKDKIYYSQIFRFFQFLQ